MPKELKGDMNGQGLHVGVIVARFNEIITRKLLDSAVETLIRHGVRTVPMTVVNEFTQIAGLVSEADVVEKIVQCGVRQASESAPVQA